MSVLYQMHGLAQSFTSPWMNATLFMILCFGQILEQPIIEICGLRQEETRPPG